MIARNSKVARAIAPFDAECILASTTFRRLAEAQTPKPTSGGRDFGVGLHHVHDATRQIGGVTVVVDAVIEIDAGQSICADDTDAVKSACGINTFSEQAPLLGFSCISSAHAWCIGCLDLLPVACLIPLVYPLPQVFEFGRNRIELCG